SLVLEGFAEEPERLEGIRREEVPRARSPLVAGLVEELNDLEVFLNLRLVGLRQEWLRESKGFTKDTHRERALVFGRFELEITRRHELGIVGSSLGSGS